MKRGADRTPLADPSARSSVFGRSAGFLRTQYWVWPLIAALVLVFVAVWVRGRMEEAMRNQLATNLHTILNANVEALSSWSQAVKHDVDSIVRDREVQRLVRELVEISQRPTATPSATQAAVLTAPQLGELSEFLQPILDLHGYDGYAVLDAECVLLAAARDHLIGMKCPLEYDEHLSPVFGGQSVLTRPFPSATVLPDEHGHLRIGVPTMFAAAPVRAQDGQVIATLGVRIDPGKDFTRILATARSGDSGETFAFDLTGMMVSESRFHDELKELNLIPDTPEACSILTLELRDPGVNLREKKAAKRRSEMAFTKPVAEILAGRDGQDVEGYRDYRGVPVVGVWHYFPELEIGLASEMDIAEAFAPLRIMRTAFWFLFSLLTLGSVVVFVLMRVAVRWQESAHQAALEARQLGQYALDDKIGAGAVGTVYRGHHALMRRPVAIKLLDPARANEKSIARFEREVQLTCTLTHPNTIAIYDYGRTPQGVFYYAMEYLAGLSLDQLVRSYGRQPEARVIHILRQACASLIEAHSQGLVHRDIKPQNIFLTRRGGIPDFVKVLDFGLVKAQNSEGELELTGANATLGTPLYMSSEAVERPDTVDPRSDLYSLGAVAFYLLTGETVFFGKSVGEVLVQQVKAKPDKPSVRMGESVSADFENLIMQCLAKSPEERPATAAALDEALASCQRAGEWTRELAEQWWRQFETLQHSETMESEVGR